MNIPPPLKHRAAWAVRLALLSSTAAAAGAAGNVEAAVPDDSVEARLRAIRAALAQQAEPGVPTHEAAAQKLAQWPNGSGWRNGGWRNY